MNEVTSSPVGNVSLVIWSGRHGGSDLSRIEAGLAKPHEMAEAIRSEGYERVTILVNKRKKVPA